MSQQYALNESRVSSQTMLAFTVGRREYAIRSVRAEGLSSYDAVTRVTDGDGFMVGFIHTGGVIAPVIDLRIQFELGVPQYDQSMSVLILNVGGSIIGIAVHQFDGVVRLTDEQIKPAPRMLHAYDADYLLGIGCIDDRKIHLLNIDRLMTYIQAVFLVEKAAA